MSGQQACKVVDIKSKRHNLPLDVILFHMVNFRLIKDLPLNQDCTDILIAASERVLDRMFTGGKFYVETFMPRRCEFESLLAGEVQAFSKGEWSLPAETIHVSIQNDNSQISA